MTNLPDPAELDLRPLPGSERDPAPGLVASNASVPADTRIEVTLVVRRRDGQAPDPAGGATLTSQQLAERFGASPADLQLVRSTLTPLGVEIVAVDPASRRVRIAGSAALLSRVFGTSLEQVTSTGPSGEATSHRHRTGGLSVPAALDGVVTAVLGLDDRPQSRTNFRLSSADPKASGTSYTPIELGEIYDFPPDTDGSGQSVAIIELGGGFEQSDLTAYFRGLGLSGVQVRAVGVDGATNVPGKDPQGADGEVELDIEVVGALAPKADIVVYFAPNTDDGFLDAVTTAAQASPAPSAMSISWGQSEDQWTAQARTAMDDAFADAAALGVTVTAAAGDNGSSDAAERGRGARRLPGLQPARAGLRRHVTAGRRRHRDRDQRDGLERRQQRRRHRRRRQRHLPGSGLAAGGRRARSQRLQRFERDGAGVPDVAGNADPQTGYQVRVDGNDLVIGGTSAVAPLWAALVARLAQATGKPLGLLQPTLYAAVAAGQVAAGFRDVTEGDNGAYSAAAGWDACTGLGVPVGQQLLTHLQS